MNRITASLTLFAALCGSAATAHSAQYTITDIGTLGGLSIDSKAESINDRGQVVGWVSDAATGYFSHAFFWPGDGTPMQDLGTFDGQLTSLSNALAINNKGWVAGWADNNGTQSAFIWKGSGPIQNIGTLGGPGAMAYGMNNLGQIVGASDLRGGGHHGFLYSNGVMTDTGSMNNIAINDLGQIAAATPVTNNQEYAYLINPGKQPQYIGSLGGTSTQPQAINNSGEIVGFSNTFGDMQSHPFIYSSGVMEDLGTLGGPDSAANGINQAGDVVGYSDTPAGAAHAFLYPGAGPILDLNGLIDPNSQWTLSTAYGINDSGQIVGMGTNPSGDEHAFLLTPTPEPSSVVLALVAGLCLCVVPPRFCRLPR